MRVDGNRAIWVADKDDFWWFWSRAVSKRIEGRKEKSRKIPIG